ncbi:unnamed protein product [Phytophthora lilii]|uniref:Unnamed protein product n=1 Tax=Phytophthora lilii TaxID=2077276 RepID=A0A9W6U731_9STRA|nr:unnamed protein product [Phytophthora lilii]
MPKGVSLVMLLGTALLRSILTEIEKIKTSRMFTKWVKKGVSADEAYKRLKIGGSWNEVLDNPQLASLSKYVDKFNLKNPNNKLSVYETLEKKLDD